MATPIRAGFTGSMTKNGGGLALPEQIHTPHILILPPNGDQVTERVRAEDEGYAARPRAPLRGPSGAAAPPLGAARARPAHRPGARA